MAHHTYTQIALKTPKRKHCNTQQNTAIYTTSHQQKITWTYFMTPEEIEKSLCIGFCQSIQTRIKADGSIQVALPFVGRDGDCYNIFVAKQVDGSFKISDKGSTIMRLSYENDLKLLKGARTEVLNQIINENGVYFDNGEIYTRSLEKDLTATVFKLGQALTRISDLGLWNKARI